MHPVEALKRSGTYPGGHGTHVPPANELYVVGPHAMHGSMAFWV